MTKSREEEQHQVAFVAWFRLQYPKYKHLLTIGSIGENIGAFRMARLKQMGLTPGYPDLVLYLPKRIEHFKYAHTRPGSRIEENYTVEFKAGLFIEMKTRKGKVKSNQREIHELLRKHHYVVEVAYDYKEAENIIKAYIKNCTELPNS